MSAKTVFSIFPLSLPLGERKPSSSAVIELNNGFRIALPSANRINAGTTSTSFPKFFSNMGFLSWRQKLHNQIMDLLERSGLIRRRNSPVIIAVKTSETPETAGRALRELFDKFSNSEKPKDLVIIAGKAEDIKHWLNNIKA